MARNERHFSGVRQGPSGSFHAGILRQGRSRHCGSWPTEELAALACDRAALFFDPDDQRLNLPTQSRRAGPCSPEQLRRLARLEKGRFRGVFPHRKKWCVAITKDGVRHRVGGFASAEAAALAHDRLSLLLGMPREILNFPDRKLRPASVQALHDELGHRRKQERSSPYLGVTRNAEGTYDARIHCGREYGIRGFDDPKEAARCRDRLALWLLGSRARLNFPGTGLLPASFETLSEERRRARRKKYTSRYVGVRIDATRSSGPLPWKAFAFGVESGRAIALGSWATERAAALAVDRAALHYFGDAARLNFPRRARDLGPADARTLRREAWHEFKTLTSSRFRGVWWDWRNARWSVKITHLRRHHFLGMFDDEERAARAYDRAAVELHGAKARLNLTSQALTSGSRARTTGRTSRG